MKNLSKAILSALMFLVSSLAAGMEVNILSEKQEFLLKPFLEQVKAISHLPAFVVQGRHDVICPPFTAFKLVQAWGRQAQLRMVDDAGHSAFEPGIIGRLMRGLDEIAQQI